MGIFSSIGKEFERVGDSISSEAERFGKRAMEEGFRWERQLGYEGVLQKSYNARKEQQKAQREAIAAQKELQGLQRMEQMEQRARQASALKLTMAEQARAKRLSVAEGIVGEGAGMMESTPVDGPNIAANKIPMLDPVDNMGNSIPEV